MKKSINITFSALFTAVICILSQICIMTPSVPLTLQTLAIALCGYILTTRWAIASVATYISVGALGLPVFSSFKGGIQTVLGPTGGFLWGFILLCLCCALSKNTKKPIFKILLSALGLILCHTTGVLQYSIISGNKISVSILTVSLPFLVKDIISIALAYTLSKFVIKRVNMLKP